MKAASVKEIKSALEDQTKEELMALCLKLSRFKKENKELLTYLLFEIQDENSYILSIKTQLDELFSEVDTKRMYIAKKNLRKIIRVANRYIKYSSNETTGIVVWLHVCSQMKALGIPMQNSTAIQNIYLGLIKKIKGLIVTLHDDLQYDFNRELNKLM
jgi:hypothetical protein